jgi:hypothetical protein
MSDPQGVNRRSLLLKLASVSIAAGFLLSLGSLAVASDLHPTPDGYVGEGRVYGFPLPYAYTVEDGPLSDTMAYQVYCTLVVMCDDGPGPQTGRGPFAPVPFAVDWTLWTLAAGLLVTTVAVTALRLRHRSARPQT